MGKKIVSQYGIVDIKKADQHGPYKLYKKVFKSKNHKTKLNEFAEIVKKYYPHYSNKEIYDLYEELAKSGCTYATMANILIEQFGEDSKSFREYFGTHLCDSDGSINYDKLMIDIYACISKMVELKITKYERCKFSNVKEAAKVLLGTDYTDNSIATLDLFQAGWSGDGIDKDGMLLFKNRFGKTESHLGTYSDLAKELLGIDDVSMNKDKLEKLLTDRGIESKFDYLNAPSKLSGLSTIKTNSLRKWMNKYFETNGIDLTLEANLIQSNNLSFDDFVRNVYSNIEDGYSVGIGTALKTEVWMSNGKEWVKPTGERAGHQMNFQGFDNEGNIVVCSWGDTYVIPKEFYQSLEFTAIKVSDNKKEHKIRY